jgi:hypothetical protein
MASHSNLPIVSSVGQVVGQLVLAISELTTSCDDFLLTVPDKALIFFHHLQKKPWENN